MILFCIFALPLEKSHEKNISALGQEEKKQAWIP